MGAVLGMWVDSARKAGRGLQKPEKAGRLFERVPEVSTGWLHDPIADLRPSEDILPQRVGIPLHHCAFSMKARNKFDSLMHAVCAGDGYCGGMHGDKFMHVTDFIPQSGDVTADQFVEWVFLAEYENKSERMSPRWDRHRQRIRDYFVEHMGSDVADASQLKWDVEG